MRRDSHISIFVAATTFIVFLPFARLGVDPHHDGIMLYPALRIANGGLIHRDAFSQYGPFTAYFHAPFVWLLGEKLIAIRIATAFYLAAGMGFFFFVGSKLYSRSVALTAQIFAITTTYFFSAETQMHPWSSDVFFFLQGSLVVLIFLRFQREKTRLIDAALSALLVLLIGTRLTTGVLTTLVVLVAMSITRPRVAFRVGSGAIILTGLFVYLMNASGGLGAWFYQTIEFPRAWYPKNTFSGAFNALKGYFAWTLVPGCAVVLLLVLLVRKNGLISQICSRRQRVLAATLLGLSLATFATIYRSGWSVIWWNPGSLGWLVGGFSLMSFLSTVFPTHTGVKTSTTTHIVNVVAIASFSQQFPVPEARHLFWSALPAFVPAIAFLRSRLGAGRRTQIVATLAAVPLVIPALISVRQNLQEKRFSVDSPVLSGMLMDRNYFVALEEPLEAASEYLRHHPRTPVLNLCTDGLFASLSPNLSQPDPYFLLWGVKQDLLTSSARLEFVRKNRPMIWFCPPAPPAESLAQLYAIRILARTQILPDDPKFDSWPFVATLGIPEEW